MDRWDFLWRPFGCSANGMGVGAHHPNYSGIPLIIVDDDGGYPPNECWVNHHYSGINPSSETMEDTHPK